MRIALVEGDFHTFVLLAEDGRNILVQSDWDVPGAASTFGWSPPPSTMTDGAGTFGEESLSSVIGDARDFLHERAGSTADDPWYF